MLHHSKKSYSNILEPLMSFISGPQSFQSANAASSSSWVKGLLSLFYLWWWLEGLGHAWSLPEQEELSQQPRRKWCLLNVGTVCPCPWQDDRSLPHREAAGDTPQTLCKLVARWVLSSAFTAQQALSVCAIPCIAPNRDRIQSVTR